MAFTDRLHNRGSISTGYDIPYSFVQEYNSTRFVSKTWGGFGGTNPTNTKATVSYWHKRASSEAGVGGGCWKLLDTQNSEVSIMAPGGTYDSSIYCAGQNESLFKLVTTAKFRDTGAWYHVVASFDSTQATASDRIKLYVNGVRITDFSTANYPAQNSDFRHISENSQHHVGHNANAGKPYGYFSDMYFIWDQAKDATDFGEFDEDTGIWKPIEYTGTFGTYGYYWDFSNTSNYAEDQSGNGNDGTSVNTTAAMQSTDTPTNNFCTLNSNSALGIVKYYEGATIGALIGTGDEPGEGSIMFNKGKWYYEARAVGTTDADAMFGLGVPNQWGLGSTNPGNDLYSFAYHSIGRVYYNFNTSTSGWDSFGTSDTVMIAIDHDNGFAYFGVNGTWGNSGVPTSGATGTGGFDYFGNTSISAGDGVTFAFRIHYRTYNQSYYNFGGHTAISIASAESDANGYGTFEYAPPTGYYALCTKNLAEFG